MSRVIHFEIPAGDPAKLIDFYGAVFGWSFQKWEGPMPYWLINTGEAGPGINGGLTARQPGATTVNTIGVTSLDDTVKAVENKAGKTVVPRMAIPGVGYLAYCVDPEGTMFGLMQADANAQ